MLREDYFFHGKTIKGAVILAAIVIYLLQPLIIVIAIAAVGYLIYRWYSRRRLVRGR